MQRSNCTPRGSSSQQERLSKGQGQPIEQPSAPEAHQPVCLRSFGEQPETRSHCSSGRSPLEGDGSCWQIGLGARENAALRTANGGLDERTR